MLFLNLFASIALISAATASPLDVPHSVHERRSEPPKGWKKRSTLDRRAVLPMRIGLKQQNLDKTWEWLSSVSHPESEKYGQHWTAKEVAEAFAPSKETVTAIKSWLTSAGIPYGSISHSQSLNWLTFPATVADAERLLNTTYHVYQHEASGIPHIACDAYSIPSHLREHVDIISPTVHFDAKIRPRNDGQAALSEQQASPNKSPGMPGSGSLPKGGFVMDMDNSHPNDMNDLKNCDSYITPACLRALYQIPVSKKSSTANSLGVVEYTPQAYLAADLDHFFANFTPAAIGERPILASIDGGVVQTTNKSFNFNGESNLDLQYAMALAYPQPVTLYQVGDLVMGASFNNFLDAIDGSYCTYEGGNDPSQDGIYPDNNGTAGAYRGPENCGGFAATKVISTSYSSDEHDLTPRYAQRQCNEYAKLGLMGVSVLYSSGDYGVAGERGECINGTGPDAPYIRNATSGRFVPSFPGTCPYVISVGATQVKPNGTVRENMPSRVQVEEACETVIYSGGGFSDLFPMPDYQESAVGKWFEDFPPPYGADRFNNSRRVRAYPDVSANGANYVVSVLGNFSRVYGTSASTPTFAAILALINQERLDAKKSTVGFINPVAYAHPEVFNDVTSGGNQGCGTRGFSSAPGWDPVTGLGTPIYPKMLDLWMSLD